MFFVFVYTYEILYILIYFMFYIYILRISFYSNLFWKNLFDIISVYLYLFFIYLS